VGREWEEGASNSKCSVVHLRNDSCGVLGFIIHISSASLGLISTELARDGALTNNLHNDRCRVIETMNIYPTNITPQRRYLLVTIVEDAFATLCDSPDLLSRTSPSFPAENIGSLSGLLKTASSSAQVRANVWGCATEGAP